MRKFRKKNLMIGFLVHLIITPYQFEACLMPLRPLLNQSRIPHSRQSIIKKTSTNFPELGGN